jgi:hypothetical protein
VEGCTGDNTLVLFPYGSSVPSICHSDKYKYLASHSEMWADTHVGLHVKCPLLLSDLNQNCNWLRNFSKTHQHQILIKSLGCYQFFSEKKNGRREFNRRQKLLINFKSQFLLPLLYVRFFGLLQLIIYSVIINCFMWITGGYEYMLTADTQDRKTRIYVHTSVSWSRFWPEIINTMKSFRVISRVDIQYKSDVSKQNLLPYPGTDLKHVTNSSIYLCVCLNFKRRPASLLATTIGDVDVLVQ